MNDPTAASSAGHLVVNEVVKAYDGLRAVDCVSLDIRAGEFVTLLGPSGSGKTTTLRMVAGFTRPDHGSVHVDGRDLTDVPAHRRDIGMVFQNYALFPHMTAAENIAFPLQMRGVRKAESRRRVEEALAMVQLHGLGGRRPTELSGGQQQRVAVARAVVFRPSVLLMDEPLGALDKNLRESLQLELMSISRGLNMTVVYVTHDQEEALVMSDRIAIYNHGRIRQIGTGEDLYKRPVSRFVASFVGESNLFPGRLAGAGRREPALLTGAWQLPVAGASTVPADAEHVCLVVRPEVAQVLPGSAHDPVDAGRPAIRGHLREVMYLGASKKYFVDTDNGTRLIARVPANIADDDVRAGDDVVMTWDPADAVLVADDGEDAHIDDLTVDDPGRAAAVG